MIKLATIRKGYNLRTEKVLSLFLPFFLASAVGKLIELGIIFSQHHFDYPKTIIGVAALRESVFIGLIFWVLFLFSPFFHKRWMKGILIFLLSTVLVFQMISTFYFVLTGEPVSVMLLDFSFGEMTTIAGDYLVFKPYYLFLPVPVFIFWVSLRFAKRFSRTWRWNAAWGLLALFALIPIPEKLSITEVDVAENKTLYFLKSYKVHFFPEELTDVKEATMKYRSSLEKKWGDINYPFLHEKPEGSSLVPFFELKETPPNIVFIIVESLSSPYSGKYADNASFTPFLDSLAEHALYFPNFLATAQRTFAVLPSSLGSLPHGNRGFTALKNNYPSFYSLPEYLIKNGYEGTFFYGGHAAFDDMNAFVTQTGFSRISDRTEFTNFNTFYQESVEPAPFGIGDRALFQNSWDEIESRLQTPKLDVYLTLSMHYPFIFEDQEYYREKAEKIIRSVKYSDEAKFIKMKKYTQELSSFLYTDDVLKNFFAKYKSIQEFENTIFIITGDHMMSEIPQKDEIEKYRAPCIIYSPLLKRPKEILAVNTQLDITPSLLALFESHYQWTTPTNVHWLGQDFDTLSTYRNERTVAFMMNNRTMKDFMHKGYFVDGKKVQKMSETGLFVEKEVVENTELVDLKNAYESLHRHVVYTNSLAPTIKQQQLMYQKWEPGEVEVPVKHDFYSLIDTEIKSNFKEAELMLEMNIHSKAETQHPLLVFSITKKSPDTTFVRYWNKIEVKELLHEKENNNYLLKIHHRIINNDLNIQSGDRLSVYFWNTNGEAIEYVLSKKNLRVFINED